MAQAPLQIWDMYGRELFNFNTRIARQLGSFSTGTSDGSTYIAAIDGPDGWIAVQAIGDYGFARNNAMIARAGGSISWRFIPGHPSPRVGVKVIYGVK